MSWISDLWGKIAGLFKKVDFNAILSAVFTAAIKLLLGKAFDTALEIVTSVSKDDLTDEEKRSKAFGDIKAKLIENGLELKDSLVNLLIEIVVQYFKKLNT